MGRQTDKIFNEIKNNNSDESTVEFIEDSKIREELQKDIDKTAFSRNQLADRCGIQPSQLSDFFKGRKNLGRDKLLSIFIELGYDLDKIQTLLPRFHERKLYVREKRDYQIAIAIQAHKSLDEIDEILIGKNVKPITPYSAY